MQAQGLGGTEIAIFLVLYLGIFLAVLGVQLFICCLMYRAAKALPPQFRSNASPGQAFLLLIPLFNIVWLFIYPKNLSQAFQAYFGSNGQLSDDCGEQHGNYWAISAACSLIPCVGAIAGLISFVYMIIYLIRINECKKQAEQMGGGTLLPTSPEPTMGGPSPDNPYQP